MRLAVRSTLTLFGLYLLVVLGLGVWMERRLRSAADSLMADTAELVGTEIAAALSETALEQLLQGDPDTRQRLVQIVSDLSRRSHVLAAVAVVDDSGRVVVSDDLEAGRQLASPAVVFQNVDRPQLLGLRSPFGGGRYHLFVPLLRQNGIVGYLRLSLRSQHIADLYRQALHQIILAAVLGLCGIVGLGLLIQVQLSRRGAALARTLEATARGEILAPPVRYDEFSQALETAGRVGRELSETRERSLQAQQRISALANFMDVGVLLLGTDWRLDFANATARELLGFSDMAQMESGWGRIGDILQAALIPPGSAERPEARADIELPAGERVRRLRLELHCYESRAGYLVLVKDRDFLEAFETDLRLATQMRSLARVYGALAHELKAPLSAMAINLELLTDALRTDAPEEPQLLSRRRRYADILREELARLNRSLVSVLNQATSLNEAAERLDLRELIRDMEALLAPQAKQQLVNLEVNLPDTPVPFVGLRDRLKQALLNIAINALEAMPKGGRLDITLRTQEQKAVVTVQDSGPGIAPEIVQKVYTMYFTTKAGGTGIGLYVARSIIESQGGQIQVESQPGRGTCFQVLLPFSKQET